MHHANALCILLMARPPQQATCQSLLGGAVGLRYTRAAMAEIVCAACGVANSEFNLRCARCDEALAATSGDSGDREPASAIDLQGREVGPYLVEGMLGRGGM